MLDESVITSPKSGGIPYTKWQMCVEQNYGLFLLLCWELASVDTFQLLSIVSSVSHQEPFKHIKLPYSSRFEVVNILLILTAEITPGIDQNIAAIRIQSCSKRRF